MIWFDIESLSKEQYDHLVDYIFGCCNEFTVHFPNFENTFATDQKQLMLKNDGTTNQEYANYLDKNQRILTLCFKNGGKKQIANEYINAKFRYTTQIIRAKLFPELKSMIKSTHIFEWQFPNMPEDICFFKGTLCRFLSTAHENEFYICNETEEDKLFLSKINVEYTIIRE